MEFALDLARELRRATRASPRCSTACASSSSPSSTPTASSSRAATVEAPRRRARPAAPPQLPPDDAGGGGRAVRRRGNRRRRPQPQLRRGLGRHRREHDPTERHLPRHRAVLRARVAGRPRVLAAATRSCTSSRRTTSSARCCASPASRTTASLSPDEGDHEAARRPDGRGDRTTSRCSATSSTTSTARPRTGTTSRRARWATRSSSARPTRQRRRRRRPLFLGPYQTHVVDQYLGGGDRRPGAARASARRSCSPAEQAGEPADHGVLDGTRARRARCCAAQGLHDGRPCAAAPTTATATTPTRLPVASSPTSSTRTLTVPASGRFEWHVGPSTRPWVGASGGVEAWVADLRDAGRRGRRAARDRGRRAASALTFANACDAGAPVTTSERRAGRCRGRRACPAARPRRPRVPAAARRCGCSSARSACRARRCARRGYLRVAMQGQRRASLSDLRLRLRRPRARSSSPSRSLRAASPGRRRCGCALRRVPRARASTGCRCAGTAGNGAPRRLGRQAAHRADASRAVERADEVGLAHRAGEEEALPELAAQRAQLGLLLGPLDALGDRREVEARGRGRRSPS